MVAIHAGCIFAGFLSLAGGAAIAAFMRDRSWWFSVHRRFGAVGVSFVILGFMAALIMVSQQTGRHFTVPHAWLGLVAILSVLGTYMLGITQAKKRTGSARSLHRWSGRVTIALLAINIVSGLFLAGIL